MKEPFGKLAGKVVLITGAAHRIGRAIALGAAAQGARVAFTYLSSLHDAQQTAARLIQAGADALAIRCDVRDPQNVQEMVREVVAEMGGIDVLINNAGIYSTTSFERISPEQWDDMFTVNTRGPFLVTRAALPYLRRRRGRVVNIGSLGGIRPWATHVHYCASKAAVLMLTQAMAKALAPRVAVNCVAPGMISMGERPDASYQSIVSKTPMGRAGSPSDVVGAVLFLASATHFITGQVLTVDGGLGL
jgi:3-oxoacyl-[acyl-carrier protein] reductase/pteridine reductase